MEVYAVDKEEEKSVKNKPILKTNTKKKAFKGFGDATPFKSQGANEEQKGRVLANHWWCLLLWSPSQAVLNRIDREVNLVCENGSFDFDSGTSGPFGLIGSISDQRRCRCRCSG